MMRLSVVEHGHTFGQKVLFKIIRLVSGFAAPDVVKTLLYRKAFFGRAQSELTQLVMRGPSPWSVGERELFAAYVSRLNQCLF
jgi:hypothetical protein